MDNKYYKLENIKNMVMNSNTEDWEAYYENNKKIYIYKHDVRLQIRDLEADGDDKKFEEPWANKFPNPNASRNSYAIYFCNNAVFKWMQVFVDGARVSLPLPKSSTELTVTEEQYKLAKIIDACKGSTYSLDNYLKRAKIIIQ